MSHWMCDDKSPVLPLRDLRPVCDGKPPEPKGDHSLVSQKGRIDPNTSRRLIVQVKNKINPQSLNRSTDISMRVVRNIEIAVVG